MVQKPPNWEKNISTEFFEKAFKSDDLKSLLKKADQEYAYWDKFRYYSMPNDISAEEAWSFLKFSRMSNSEMTPLKDANGSKFIFRITKNMYQKLSLVDSNTSGFLSSEVERPSNIQKSQLIISGLTEEAIASSQIEGANTSRKVAKEMLLSQRKARTKDEQMIINNYQVMQRLMDWKDLQLSQDILLEMQRNITIGTLEDEKDAGRLRKDEDDIVVVNRMSGETVFTPPNAGFVSSQLQRLIDYANTDESEDEFVHPVIKASILLFWLAYLHPFVDGNGRTARALFYWYMLKKQYWMFQYLSVSRIIKKSKIQYDNSFLYSEYDDNDMTYFLVYKLKAIVLSIKEFVMHYQHKLQEEKIIQRIAGELGEFNARQVSLLQELQSNKDKTIDINIYKSKNRISYETARTDLMYLAKKNLLDRIHVARKFVFVPNTSAISNILEKTSV